MIKLGTDLIIICLNSSNNFRKPRLHSHSRMVDAKSQASSKALIISMVGPLMNKIKMSMSAARKNVQLAQKLQSTIDMLGEQLLPHYLTEGSRSYEEVNMIHNLCYLMAMKTQQVFNSRVIHTCIDQNWDLKGFK